MNILVKAKYSAPIAVLLVLSLLYCTACNGTTVVSDVTTGINVAEGLVPLILALVPGGAAFVLPAEAFLKDAVTGLNSVAAVLQQTGLTRLEVAEQCTAALASVVTEIPAVQALLGGAPANITAGISSLIAILGGILGQYGTPAISASNVRAAQTTYWQASSTDRKRLAAAHLRCQVILAQLP